MPRVDLFAINGNRKGNGLCNAQQRFRESCVTRNELGGRICYDETVERDCARLIDGRLEVGQIAIVIWVFVRLGLLTRRGSKEAAAIGDIDAKGRE